MMLPEDQVSEFDIYINADLMRNSALTEPRLRINLEQREYIDDQERITKVHFNKLYTNTNSEETLGLIGLKGGTPIELSVDIDTEIGLYSNDPSLSKAELLMGIDQESHDDLILDVNSFEFLINGVSYNINNLPADIDVEFDADEVLELPDAFVIQHDVEASIEITILAPIGTTVELVSFHWTGSDTDFDSILDLNKLLWL